jgi:hypothetical protein
LSTIHVVGSRRWEVHTFCLGAFVIARKVNTSIKLHATVVFDVMITSFANTRSVSFFYISTRGDAGPRVSDISLTGSVGLHKKYQVFRDVRNFNRLDHWGMNIITAEVNVHSENVLRTKRVHASITSKTNMAFIFQLKVNVDIGFKRNDEVSGVSGNVGNVNLVREDHHSGSS